MTILIVGSELMFKTSFASKLAIGFDLESKYYFLALFCVVYHNRQEYHDRY